MRFMMLMIPGVYQGKEGEKAGADFTPDPADVDKMMKYNEQLAKAGVLISLDGLHSPATSARVSFKGGKPAVTDGPFAGSTETLGGYWMIQVKSREEAIDWARRVPAQEGDVIEVRRVFEMEEFPEDVQRAAENPTVKAQLEKQQKG
jgi:hypothetical protein